MRHPDRTTASAAIHRSRLWVIKIGSAALIDPQRGIIQRQLDNLCWQIATLHQQGLRILLVASGSIAEGRRRLAISARSLHETQAAAAIGQSALVEAFHQSFARQRLSIAQILLSYADLADRRRYLNIRATLRSLLRCGVIPILNENDTISIGEDRFGNNDTLAGYACNLIEAQTLIMLTDQRGLYRQDPRLRQDAEFIETIAVDDPHLTQIAQATRGELGTGGMRTKVHGAQIAARSGTISIITASARPTVLQQIAAGEIDGTLLVPAQEPLAARKRWLISLRINGELALDAGAVTALTHRGMSLLPAGVIAVSGNFERGEPVACVDAQGQRIAVGLINYSTHDAHKIQRQSSHAIRTILGHRFEDELIHRDNLALL